MRSPSDRDQPAGQKKTTEWKGRQGSHPRGKQRRHTVKKKAATQLARKAGHFGSGDGAVGPDGRYSREVSLARRASSSSSSNGFVT